MSERTPDPDVEQLTIWRNVLDALGQLDAAWGSVVDSSEDSDGEAGSPPRFPDGLALALTSAGMKGSQVLAGLADALNERSGEDFSEVASAQAEVEALWNAVHARMSENESDQD
ncbi:hypothetical protein [Saccharopolyspora sp. NPDC049357]|uniref:hypothetical protein n=1 Tax=Saccharopolyspora sp. NPDC049357 TaxID=3154507 RepID=UPI003441D24B